MSKWWGKRDVLSSRIVTRVRTLSVWPNCSRLEPSTLQVPGSTVASLSDSLGPTLYSSYAVD